MCHVTAAGDDNRGTGDGWAQKIKDSLPDVRALRILPDHPWDCVLRNQHRVCFALAGLVSFVKAGEEMSSMHCVLSTSHVYGTSVV